eukprot:m.51520 g.51520  ORF g.51520 m.51520 type:complete len:329 (-) comp12997_c0_seq1:463-1449(-)
MGGGSSKTPAFSLEQSRYDVSTYMGRVFQCQDNTDARTLFTTTEQIDKAKALLQAFASKTLPPGVSDEELWQARKIRDATLHPESGKVIPAPFRFAAFAPVNIPIVAALIYPTNNALFLAAAQFTNQSYNVAVNYNNGNGDLPVSRLMAAYGAAVTTSCALAIGFNRLLQRYESKLGKGVLIRSLGPITAVSVAGIVNLLCIRYPELVEGVRVYDQNGKDRGMSKEAGRDALFKCSLARVIWTVPGMLIPPVIMAALDRFKAVRSSPRLRMVSEIGVIALTIWAVLPFAIAVFPQRDSLPTSRLEPELRNLQTDDGKPVERVWFNKGI